MIRTILLIFIIALIIYFYFQNVKKTIKIKLNLAGIDYSGFDFNSLNLNQTIIKARIELLIFFSYFTNISISDFNIKIYKNGLLIAESTKNVLENTKQITLFHDLENKIYQTLDFHLNNETINLIYALKNNKSYSLQYETSFKILGIKITYNNTYNNN